jgi:hypothetical protein
MPWKIARYFMGHAGALEEKGVNEFEAKNIKEQ